MKCDNGLESLINVRPHIISHVTFVVSALYKTMNQNELERRVENSRLSIFRSHVRSTFIIAAKGSYHAARKKVCCCTQQQTTNFLPQRDLDGSYHAASIIFSAAIYECLFWVVVDWLRFHVRKERGHFQLSDERIHQNNLWSKSSIAYQIQLRFKNIFICDMTFIVSA